jgi:hypothetical protein
VELGNIFFGNARGNFEIERRTGWEEELERLFDKIDSNHGGYGVNFENNIFRCQKYSWNDCEEIECPVDNNENKCQRNICEITNDNFWYKPTDFGIQWYKYPLRDAYKNQNITLEEFKNIIDKCLESLI